MTAMFTKAGKVSLLDGDKARDADISNPVDILSWMRNRAEFEEGLTFFGLLECLAPWSPVVSMIAGMDFDAWKAACKAPSPQEPILDPLLRIEIRPSVSVFRVEETSLADVSVEWQVFGVLEQPYECDGRTIDSIGLNLTHPSIYADLQVIICNEASIEDVMTGGDVAPWDKEEAIHPTEDGHVKGFTVSPTVVNTIFYGILGDISSCGSPDDVVKTSDVIIRAVEEIDLPQES